MPQDFPHDLNRKVVIRATPETVFGFFTDNERWSAWWGKGSTIAAEPGGKVYIRYPNGVEVLGEVIEVRAPERIVFSYGYANGKPIGLGESRVTIEVVPDEEGTLLRLRHEFSEAAVRDQHVQGWRYQLSLFANAVAAVNFASAKDTVDRWFAAWAIADEAARAKEFAAIASPDARFRDRYSSLAGLEDLTEHAGASQRFMPGVVLSRKGEIRQCQGMVLVDWIVAGPAGKERMAGANVFLLRADGKIESVTGLS